MRHARNPDRLFEVLCDELRPLSEMILGRVSGRSSVAPCKMISMSASVTLFGMSRFTM
jgi:hypothetical protein